LELQISELQILIDLGLTLKQARVYMALVESGSLRISAISKISKVARPDVYQTLLKLQKLGLVERIIETPLKYRAIPMNEALSLLLKTKTEQYEKVRAETRMLLDTVKTKRLNSTNQLEVPQFVLIPKGRTIKRIKTAIEKAQISMDLVLSWKRFSCGIASTFAESIEIAWAKNVKIRFIIESPSKSKTAKELVQFCREKPFSQIKFIRHYPAIVLGIYDKKEAFLIVKPEKDLPGSPALWSNNPGLIALAKDYFETLWLTAMESNHRNPRKHRK
jgi:sugar-specific transcriptional regulator TrmB